MSRNIIETVVAGVVLIIAGGFLFFALTEVRPPRGESYPLQLAFDSATDLKPGAEVQIAGVAVGRVLSIDLDQERFEVTVAIQMDAGVLLPRDTRARITVDGLMGSGIVQLLPGKSAETLAPGGRIYDTESPVNIVDQFGRFLYSGDTGDSSGGPDSPDGF